MYAHFVFACTVDRCSVFVITLAIATYLQIEKLYNTNNCFMFCILFERSTVFDLFDLASLVYVCN